MEVCPCQLHDFIVAAAYAKQMHSVNLSTVFVGLQILFNCIVPLCASNWILLKMTEKLIEPSTFATLRQA